MMLDKETILAPAKLNIFLKILGKRSDGYHFLRSGVTFINLYDEVKIEKSNETKIIYQGPFKPLSNNYDDCIVKKILTFFNLYKDIKVRITITKNIPVQGGLGSASTNAAAIIKWLEKRRLIDKKKIEDYINLGSDIPCCLFNKNCLIMGIGDKIYTTGFPKYYFLLIKPIISNSTAHMYHKLNFKLNSYDERLYTNEKKIIIDEIGNDFEKIILNENNEFRQVFNFMQNLDNAIFTRMTGTGSCIYSAFNSRELANNAYEVFKLKHKNLWSVVCENNL